MAILNNFSENKYSYIGMLDSSTDFTNEFNITDSADTGVTISHTYPTGYWQCQMSGLDGVNGYEGTTTAESSHYATEFVSISGYDGSSDANGVGKIQIKINNVSCGGQWTGVSDGTYSQQDWTWNFTAIRNRATNKWDYSIVNLVHGNALTHTAYSTSGSINYAPGHITIEFNGSALGGSGITVTFKVTSIIFK